jgi:hypothetical protein
LETQLCSWSCRRLISRWRWESSCAMRDIVAVNQNVFLNESPRLLSYPYYFTGNDIRNIISYFQFGFTYTVFVSVVGCCLSPQCEWDAFWLRMFLRKATQFIPLFKSSTEVFDAVTMHNPCFKSTMFAKGTILPCTTRLALNQTYTCA